MTWEIWVEVNAEMCPPEGARPRGVFLYERDKEEGRWLPIRWAPHLWWTRFLLAAHVSLQGTRYETISSIHGTGQFLCWWLESTSHAERVAFFADPDVPALVRSLRRQHHWARGFHSPVHDLLRTYRAVRESHPAVLRPCQGSEAHPALSYSVPYGRRAVRSVAEDLCSSLAAHTVHETDFATELLSRWGVRLAEALAEQRPVATSDWCLPLGAVVRRYRALHGPLPEVTAGQ